MTRLDTEQKQFIKELIIDIYKYQLIFTDFKLNEFQYNNEDELFIIPYRNQLNSYIDLLKSITTYSKRILHLIENECKKTLKSNNENIDRLIQYSIKLIEGGINSS